MLFLMTPRLPHLHSDSSSKNIHRPGAHYINEPPSFVVTHSNPFLEAAVVVFCCCCGGRWRGNVSTLPGRFIILHCSNKSCEWVSYETHRVYLYYLYYKCKRDGWLICLRRRDWRFWESFRFAYVGSPSLLCIIIWMYEVTVRRHRTQPV